MTLFKRMTAILLTVTLVISLSACNGSDDDTVLTTRKTTTTTKKAGGDIDIWGYLESGDFDDEEPATVGSGASLGGGISSSGSYTYEEAPLSFGGSDVFSSVTTSKQGYPSFSWNAVPGAIKYNIYRATSQNGTYSYIDSTTATSYTDKTAISGKQYYYQVKAVKKVDSTTTTTKKTNTASKTTASAQITERDLSNAPASGQTFNATQLVAFYNAAANRVKTNAANVTLRQRTVTYLDEENNSETLKTLVTLAGATSVDSSNAKTYQGHDNIVANFPRENKEVSSELAANMVNWSGSVSGYKYEKGYYLVQLTLKNDPAKTTEYSGTCVDVIDFAGYYSGATSETRGTTIYAKISYDGYLDYVMYTVPTWAYVTYNGNDGNVNMQLAFSVQETWSINY